MRNSYLRRQQLHSRRKEGLTGEGSNNRLRHKEAVLASATIVSRPQIRRALADRDWQTELWVHFDRIGELRFAVRWLANAVSRCTLFIGEQPEGGGDPTPVESTPDNEAARALLSHLHYGHVGQAEMLRRMALHLSVPGETYLVGLDPEEGAPTRHKRWYVASSKELTVNTKGVSTFVLPDTGETIRLDPQNSTIIRMWIPHPNRGWEPDSPISATLPVLREVEALSQHIQASVESRLAGAGLLLIPNSASILPSPRQTDGQDDTAPYNADNFTHQLTEAMVTPLQDRGDASSVVPIVARVPDDSIGKVQHISFATQLSDKVMEMRRDALDRFAAGADLPREVVTGTGSANHWGAWQLEESSIKLHVEPLIGVICDALTQQYLWPGLQAMGIADPERFVVWYDPSELSHRPNKATEATTLWNMGVLNTTALLRENGFNPDTDAPSEEERLDWITLRAAVTNPTLFNLPPLDTALDLGTEGDRALPSAPQGAPPALAAAAPTPDTSPGSAASGWWLCAVEQVALRALALAGNRLFRDVPRSDRRRHSEVRSVHLWDVHTVVQASKDTAAPGERSSVDRVLQGAYDTATAAFADDDCALSTVRAYCRHLVATGQPHRREYLATWLERAGCWPPGNPAPPPATPGKEREEVGGGRV